MEAISDKIYVKTTKQQCYLWLWARWHI